MCTKIIDVPVGMRWYALSLKSTGLPKEIASAKWKTPVRMWVIWLCLLCSAYSSLAENLSYYVRCYKVIEVLLGQFCWKEHVTLISFLWNWTQSLLYWVVHTVCTVFCVLYTVCVLLCSVQSVYSTREFCDGSDGEQNCVNDCQDGKGRDDWLWAPPLPQVDCDDDDVEEDADDAEQEGS